MFDLVSGVFVFCCLVVNITWFVMLVSCLGLVFWFAVLLLVFIVVLVWWIGLCLWFGLRLAVVFRWRGYVFLVVGLVVWASSLRGFCWVVGCKFVLAVVFGLGFV